MLPTILEIGDVNRWIRGEQLNSKFISSAFAGTGIVAQIFYHTLKSAFLNTEVTAIELSGNADYPIKVIYKRDGIESFVLHKEIIFTNGIGKPLYPTQESIFPEQFELEVLNESKYIFGLDEFLLSPMVTEKIITNAIQKAIRNHKEVIHVLIPGANLSGAAIASALTREVENFKIKNPTLKIPKVKISWIGFPKNITNAQELKEHLRYNERHSLLARTVFNIEDPFDFNLIASKLSSFYSSTKIALLNSEQLLSDIDLVIYGIGYNQDSLKSMIENFYKKMGKSIPPGFLRSLSYGKLSVRGTNNSTYAKLPDYPVFFDNIDL